MSGRNKDSQGNEILAPNSSIPTPTPIPSGMQVELVAEQPVPLVDPVPVTPTDSRMTHKAMTQDEEIAYAKELSASGKELDDIEKAQVAAAKEAEAIKEAQTKAMEAANVRKP